MKRLRFAALLMLLAAPCLAAPTGRLLLVEPPPATVERTDPSASLISGLRFRRILHAILEKVGADYDVIDYTQMKTVWGKTGIVGYDFGKTGSGISSYTKTYAAICWVSPAGVGTASYGVGAGRPDSLFNSGYVYNGGTSPSGLAVPNLCLESDYIELRQGGTVAMTATCCSTGVNNYDNTELYVYGLQHPVGTRMGWFTAGLYQKTMTARTAKPAAGYRAMLVANQPAAYVVPPSVNCGFCDSIPGADNATTKNDSVIVWQLPFANIAGSKPMIMAYADGVGGPNGDSLTNAGGDVTPTTAEIDPTVILYALSVLDSASGKAIFDRSKLPIRLGLTIDAEGCVTSNRAGPGICPQDSSVRNASIDSIAALNALPGVKVRAVVGLNATSAESLAAIAGTINRWRSIGTVKFSPQVWGGVLTTATQVSAGAGFRRAATGPGDVFGFNRSRFFVGDGAGGGDGTQKDTSVVRMLRWSRLLMNAAGIRDEEISRTYLPPLDDWAPQNRQTAADMDSALYALRLAGFTAVRSNANLPQSNFGSLNGTSMGSATYRGISSGLMGYTSQQGVYRDAGGGQVAVLAHAGQEIFGGHGQSILDDSTNTGTNYWGNITLFNLFRTVGGLLNTRDHFNYDYWAFGSDFGASYWATQKDQTIPHTLMYQGFFADRARLSPRRASILKLNVADLSGCVGCARGAPARNGWWTIKSLKNWMDACNNADGGTVVEFAYPEDVNPR